MAGVPSIVASGGFRRLAGAQLVSSFGDWLATFALMALVLDISGSAAAVGGVLALRMAPAAVAGPMVGWVGSRWGRRRIMVGLDGIRALAVAAIPLVRALWWVYVLAFVVEVATVLAITARDSSIRDLVEEPDLPVANGIVMGTTYLGIPLGAGAFTIIGVSVLAGAKYVAAFGLDALTFVVSLLIIRSIRDIPADPDIEVPAGTHVRLRDAWGVPAVRTGLPPIAAASLGIGTLFSLGIGFVRETLGASDAQFGVLVLVFGTGAVLGLALRSKVTTDGAGPVRFGVAAMGAVQLSMALASGVPLAFAMALAFGAAGAYSIVSGLTLLQTELEPGEQMLGLGGFHVAVRLALAIGALAAGSAVDIVAGMDGGGLAGLGPVRSVMVVSGALVMISALVIRPRIGASRS